MTSFTNANYAHKADERESVSWLAIVTIANSVPNWSSSTKGVLAFTTAQAKSKETGDAVKKKMF